MTNEMNPLVVVGVDGSEGSKAALRWAADYVRRSHGRLQVVGAWQYPAMYYGYAVALPEEDLAAETERTLHACVIDVLDAEPDVPVETRVAQGPAAQVLLDAASAADLLVVGSRGHGAFAGMLLGSVSSHCVHHARCPVAVIRPANDRDKADH